MGTCKGNLGNLMQHWTLCEVLQVANANVAGLSFVDAYAMAPRATPGTKSDKWFKCVKSCLPGKGSAYEQAWHSLSEHQPEGYPNSASFVSQLWKRNFSLILCEKDCQTADEIDEWLPVTRKSSRCREAVVFPGDWRERFLDGLPNSSGIGLPAGSLTMVSFDPTMYSSKPSPVQRHSANLYRTDLGLALYALKGVAGPIIVQLSTYTSSGNNPQNKVIESVNSVLTPGQFKQAAVVRANSNMMSLVYTRDVDWADDLCGLPARFEEWRRP